MSGARRSGISAGAAIRWCAQRGRAGPCVRSGRDDSLLGPRADTGRKTGCGQRERRIDRPRRHRARNAAPRGAQADRGLAAGRARAGHPRAAVAGGAPPRYRSETDEEAIIRGLIDREGTVPEPDDETCRRYYDRNGARFRSPDIYEASHILFAALASNRAAHAKAHEDAAAVLAELREQPSRFAELAQAHSRCPSAAQGGNLG